LTSDTQGEKRKLGRCRRVSSARGRKISAHELHRRKADGEVRQGGGLRTEPIGCFHTSTRTKRGEEKKRGCKDCRCGRKGSHFAIGREGEKPWERGRMDYLRK